MLPWIVVLILSLVVAPSVTAQMSDRACADSFQRFSELSLRLEQQVQEDLAKAGLEKQVHEDSAKQESKDFDVTLYRAHLQEFTKLIDAGRTHLSNCSSWDSTKNETYVLEYIGHGLVNVGQPEDAIPIFKRCVAFDKENTGCWAGLGEAYDRVCRFDDAIEAYKKIIEIGGFTEINARRVETAKLAISNDDSASKQEEWRKLFHCPPKQSDVKSTPNR